MKRKLEKLLAALLCCALLMSGMVVALGDELEAEEPIIVEETADESAPEASEAEAEEVYEAPVDEAPYLGTEEGEADAEALAEEAVELEPEDVAEPEEGDEGEALIGHEELEVAESEAEAAPETPEEVDVSMAEALGEPELAEATENDYGEETFTNETFLAYLLDNFDTDGNGRISQTEADCVSEIAVEEDYGSYSLEGIGVFKNLEALYCAGAGLTELDVSQNTKLKSLNCSENQLSSLDLEALTDLQDLDCSDNPLETLDISGNQMLTTLYCNKTNLTELDIAGRREICLVQCMETGISRLDISQCPVLKLCLRRGNSQYEDEEKTMISHNYYTEEEFFSLAYDVDTELITGEETGDIPLDEEHFPDRNLRRVISETFDLADIYVPVGDEDECDGDYVRDGVLSEAEVVLAKKLYTSGEGIRNLKGIGYLSGLVELDLSGNKLTQADLSGNPALEFVDLSSNMLKQFALADHDKLDELHLEGNVLTNLSLSNCPAMKRLYASDNKLTALKLNSLPALEVLDVNYNNSLTALNISEYPRLRQLKFSGTKVANINLSTAPDLERLECVQTPVKQLNVSPSKMLAKTVKGMWPGYESGLWCEAEYSDGSGRQSDDGIIYSLVCFPVGSTVIYGSRILKSMAMSKSASAPYISVNDRLVVRLTSGRVKKITKNSRSAVAAARVVNGMLRVSGKKNGKTVVTFTTTKGKTLKLTVTVADPTVPRTIKMSQTRVTRIAGQAASVTLKANLAWYADPLKRTRNTKVTWTSSNTRIASVEGGVVKLLKPGQVTITAKAAGGKKATCVVTIKRNKIDNINKKPDAKRIARVRGFSEGLLKSVEIVNPNRVVVEWYALNGNKSVYENTQVLDTVVGWKQNGVKKQLAEKSCDGLAVNIPAKSSKVVKLTYTLSEPIQYYTNLAKLKPSQMYGIWDDAGE